MPPGLLSSLDGRGLPSSVQASRSAASAAADQLGGAQASAVWAPRLWSTGSGLVVHRFGLHLGAWGRPLGAWGRPLRAWDRPLGAWDCPLSAWDRPLGVWDLP